jgi:hypothetical protein
MLTVILSSLALVPLTPLGNGAARALAATPCGVTSSHQLASAAVVGQPPLRPTFVGVVWLCGYTLRGNTYRWTEWYNSVTWPAGSMDVDVSVVNAADTWAAYNQCPSANAPCPSPELVNQVPAYAQAWVDYTPDGGTTWYEYYGETATE